MTTDAETVQLSRIYNRFLLDLESVGNFDLLESDRAQAMELLSGAVADALTVVSRRCPRCDSERIKVVCEDCEESHERRHTSYCGLNPDHDGQCVAVVTRMLGV